MLMKAGEVMNHVLTRLRAGAEARKCAGIHVPVGLPG